MMIVRLSGVTSLRDSKCSELLAQWMSLSPLIRARFTEAMDHAPLPAVHKTKVQAIRTYAEALFPAPYLIGLLLELGAPRSGFRVLSEYITRWGDAYTARTGLPFPRPIPTRDIFLWLPDRTEDRSGLVGKIATCWAKIGSRVWKGGRNDGLDGFLRFNNILKKSSKTGFRDR